ncbi:NAD-dependent deacetylase [Thermodesulfobacteriota bacterium]
MSDLQQRIDLLAQLIINAEHPVFFTGAGISTDSGLPDFRGPDGVWTRRDKGLEPVEVDWSQAKPNASHKALVELQGMGKMAFLITQNIDNLHLVSGIHPELLAELHGNLFKLQCKRCGFKLDNFPDLVRCPICDGALASSVVDFGDSLPVKDLQDAGSHSKQCDLFVVIGSSLFVQPAASMPRIAIRSEAKLVILNAGETPFDRACHLRFREPISEVLPAAIHKMKTIKEGDHENRNRKR